MLTLCSQPQGQRPPLSLCQILGFCAAWISLSHARAQPGMLRRWLVNLRLRISLTWNIGAGSFGPLDVVGLIPSQASKRDSSSSSTLADHGVFHIQGLHLFHRHHRRLTLYNWCLQIHHNLGLFRPRSSQHQHRHQRRPLQSPHHRRPVVQLLSRSYLPRL